MSEQIGIERKQILGVNIDFGYDLDAAVAEIEKIILSGKGSHLVATTNPYFIMAAQQDEEFKDIINRAALSVPDGVGVLYANYYLNKISKIKKGTFFPLQAFLSGLISGVEGFTKKEEFGRTVTGVDLTDRLCAASAQKGYTIFILGGGRRDIKGNRLNENYDMAEEAENILMSKYPNVHIIGSTSRFSKWPKDDAKTLSYVHNCMKEHNINNIDIMLVAYNPLQQEKWIQRNARKIPARISIGIGRTLNYITGDMKQPSTVYERVHMMWLYTLIKQPWRVKRVMMTFPLFPLKVFIESIKT